MRRGGVIVLIATSFAGSARADESPAVPPPPLEGEIAWARATWPDVFKGVRFGVPIAKLRAWAPPRGEVPAYLYTEIEEHCIAITIERERRSEDDEGYGQGPPALTGRVIGRTRVEKGRPTRSVTFIEVGEELTSTPANFTIEAQNARGRWRSVGGLAAGMEPNSYGWLSYVDDRVARWDADPQRLHIECAVEPLACADGGERPCRRCDRTAVYLLPLNTTILRSDRPPGTCKDPCPDSPEGPDIARLRRLDRRVEWWRPKRTRVADTTSLYKSEADCLSEHPKAARRADR